MKRFILFLWIFCSCAGHGPARRIHLVVLHTNDIHGHAWATEGRGGFAAQAALIEKIRRENSEGVTLVVSGGDVNTGVPDSDMLAAEPDFTAMNRIGYDAMAMGNHDLDGGIEKLRRQVGWAKFPILSSNVLDTNGKPLLLPSTVIERRGIKIGIVGLTTETLKHIALPRNVESIVVKDAIASAKQEVEKLRTNGAEIILALTHVGVSESGKRSHTKFGNDDVAIAREVPELAAVIGGHTHTLLEHGIAVGKRLVVQAGENGQYLGRLDIEWDLERHEIENEVAEVLPVQVSSGEDEGVRQEMERFRALVGKRLDQQVGMAEADLKAERDLVRGKESSLGDFICDVLRAETGSDVAFFNSGGIRASIRRGPITRRDLLKVLPFGNTVVTAMMTGKQVKAALASGVEHRNAGGGFLQVSGVSYRIRKGRVVEVTRNGRWLGDETRLKVASNNFLFSGGDFHEELKGSEAQNETGTRVEEMLLVFLQRHPRVGVAAEGRIRVDD